MMDHQADLTTRPRLRQGNDLAGPAHAPGLRQIGDDRIAVPTLDEVAEGFDGAAFELKARGPCAARPAVAANPENLRAQAVALGEEQEGLAIEVSIGHLRELAETTVFRRVDVERLKK